MTFDFEVSIIFVDGGIPVRRRGKAHSRRPVSKRPPSWCKYSREEVEALVIKFAKEGYSPSQIGILLRDQYSIPLIKSIVGKSVTEIIQSVGIKIDIPEDLSNLLRKAARLRRHLFNNKADTVNKKSLELVNSKIRRLMKYYKKQKVLPNDWEYKPKSITPI